MAWRSSQQAQHWEDVTGDMTEEKEDMTTRKITSFLIRIIFLNKEIGACEKNIFVHIKIILMLKDLIFVNTNYFVVTVINANKKIYFFSEKKVNCYISDLSGIQNIIYLTANFVFVPIQINLRKPNKRKKKYK